MKYLEVILGILCLLCSCNHSDSDFEITMKDGSTIKVYSLKRIYLTEEDFVHHISFSFPLNYNVTNIEHIDYLNNTEYTVYDYNQSFIGEWEIAEFGDWIKKYGLIPLKPYYVSTHIYVKYLSEPPKGLRIIPKIGGEYMGYCPAQEYSTFRVLKDANEKLNVLMTGFRYIGYDFNRNSVKINVPSFIDNNNDKLTWKFLIRDDGWD